MPSRAPHVSPDSLDLCPSPVEYKPFSSRRQFIALSGMAALAAFLPGCGDGGAGVAGGGSAGSFFSPLINSLATLLTNQTPVGTHASQSVTTYAVLQNAFALPAGVSGQPVGGNFNAMFWTAHNASGTPTRIAQMLAWYSNTNDPIRVAFNAQGLPVYAQSLDSGYRVRLTWDLANHRVTIRGFGPGGFMGGSVVQGSGSGYTISPIPGRLAQQPESSSADQSRGKTRNEDPSYNSHLWQLYYFFYSAAASAPWLISLANDLGDHMRDGQLFGLLGLGILLFAGFASSEGDLFSLNMLTLILFTMLIMFASFWSPYISKLSQRSSAVVLATVLPFLLVYGAHYAQGYAE